MSGDKKTRKKIEVPHSPQQTKNLQDSALQSPVSKQTSSTYSTIPYNSTSPQRAVFVMPENPDNQSQKPKTNINHNVNISIASSHTPQTQQSFFKRPTSSYTEQPSDFKNAVLNALQKEINRLKGKLEGFFSWFTWNKALVKDKIATLEQIQDTVTQSSDEKQIFTITSEISKSSKKEQDTQATSCLTTNCYQSLKKTRNPFSLSELTDTQVNIKKVVDQARPFAPR